MLCFKNRYFMSSVEFIKIMFKWIMRCRLIHFKFNIGRLETVLLSHLQIFLNFLFVLRAIFRFRFKATIAVFKHVNFVTFVSRWFFERFVFLVCICCQVQAIWLVISIKIIGGVFELVGAENLTSHAYQVSIFVWVLSHCIWLSFLKI